MKLFVSFLVLVLSLCCLNPLLLAYRLPNKIYKRSNSKAESSLLTVNSDAFSSEDSDSSNILRQKISYFNELMSTQKLYGMWQSLNNMQEKNFGNHEGFSTLTSMSEMESYEDSFDLMLCFYNGLYTNTNYTCVTFSEFIPLIQDQAFNEKNATLSFTNITVHLAEGETDSINQLGTECVANSTVYFLDTRSNSAFVPSYDLETDQANFAVQFSISSSDCSLTLITNEMTSEDTLTENQAMNYSIAMSVAAFFQGILCFVLNKILEQKKNYCQRVSQGTLRIINAFDFYLAVESFFQLSNNVMVGFMALPYGILSFYCETKVIRTISVTQGNLAERGFSGLNIINNICLVFSMFTAAACVFFQKPEIMFVLFCLHQVPQIVQNYKMHKRVTSNDAVLLFFIVPKLAYITYVLVFPCNLFRYSPDIKIAIILGGVLLLQVLLLAIQRKYPTLWKRGKIVYQLFSTSQKKHKEEVCCICLENPETTTEGTDDSLLTNPDKENNTMILTPCQHQFHECCLRDWIKLKCVCPYCRASLPPMADDDN